MRRRLQIPFVSYSSHSFKASHSSVHAPPTTDSEHNEPGSLGFSLQFLPDRTGKPPQFPNVMLLETNTRYAHSFSLIVLPDRTACFESYAKIPFLQVLPGTRTIARLQ
jgi:hypothetical protein